jgi:chaperonin GroEL
MYRNGNRAISQRVIFQPATYRGLQRGINQVANAIRPTLGPRPRFVTIDNVDLHDKTPQPFDDGGSIARYIIQLPDRDEDMGAMLIRDLLWRLQKQEGDGTATAAVLFQAIYNEGVRYLASGGNAMRLKSYLEEGMHLILDRLADMTIPVEGQAQLAQVAQSLCYDPGLATHLGEILDTIGEYGRLEIRKGRSRHDEREYVQGIYWYQGLVSRQMHTDPRKPRVEFEDAAILISDLEIEEPQQLYPALELALRARIPALLIVADKLSDSAISFLLTNRAPERFQVVAVKTPGWDRAQKMAALEDLAILTGGRPFLTVAGDTFHHISTQDLGRAQRVWAAYDNFGIIEGQGDPNALNQHVANLCAAYADTDNIDNRNKLRKRIGRLLGNSATLWIGGATEMEVDARVETAKRAAATLRGAMMEGILPGGGVALLSCRSALRRSLESCVDFDQRAAYRILIKAMEAPFRTIVDNAGYDASQVMAEVQMAGPGRGFDATVGEIVDVMEAGIYDAAPVVKAAVYGALTTATLALTIDVLVHHAELEQAAPPQPTKRKHYR